jgi:translation elongation factor EF-G
MNMPPAVLSLEIAPKTQADQQRLTRGLQVLAARDPDLRISPVSHAIARPSAPTTGR